jgi:hypothetical protein
MQKGRDTLDTHLNEEGLSHDKLFGRGRRIRKKFFYLAL